MLKMTVAAVALIAVLPASAGNAPGAAASGETVFLADARDAAHSVTNRGLVGVASLAVSKGGRLWATWYTGASREPDEGNYCVLASSGDGGETWQEVAVVDPDGPGPVRSFDAQLWMAPDGVLRWSWTQRRGTETTDPSKDEWYVLPIDDPDEIPARLAEPKRLQSGIMMCKPSALTTGEWAFPLALWQDERSVRMGVSTDGLASVSLRGGVSLPKALRGVDEPVLVERRDGSLWCLIRTAGRFHESFSSDRGKTWSPPVPSRIGQQAARLFVRRLRSGNLLLVKNGRAPDAKINERTDLTAFISKDDGATWEGGLVLDDRPRVAYPDGQQTEDGVIHLIYDRDRQDAREILLATVTEEDVLAGRPVTKACRLRRIVSKSGPDAFPAAVDKGLGKDETVVLIGDSITYLGYCDGFGYYNQLTNALATLAPERNVNVIPLGVCGIKVGDWLERLRGLPQRKVVVRYGQGRVDRDVGEVFSNRVDVVAVFLGMNDLLKPSLRDDARSVARWKEDARALVREIRARAHPRQFVLCTVTPLTADPESPKNLVRGRLNDALRALAAEEGATVADYGAEIEALQTQTTAWRTDYRVVPDFVHPNALGHTALARALAAALGEKKLARHFADKLARELAEGERNERRGPVSVRLWPSRANKVTDRLLAYDIEYHVVGGEASVTVDVPEGWTATPCAAGRVTVKGRPDRALNRVTLRFARGGESFAYDVDIPAPWRVSAPFDFEANWRGQAWLTNAPVPVAFGDVRDWSLSTGTWNYTAGNEDGSIDPYQVFFGGNYDSFYAVRRVWSERARDVDFRFSHKTFSGTFGFVLTVDGVETFVGEMNRNGRNEVVAPARLRRGWNEVRLRVDHANWQRQMACAIRARPGDDLGDLCYDWSVPPAPAADARGLFRIGVNQAGWGLKRDWH